MRRFVCGIALVGSIALAGCSGIGDGNGLESLTLVPFSGAQEDGSMKVFECVRSRLNAFGTFSNSTIGDYTARVRWLSSNPAVVRVSNGDEPVPGQPDQVFVHGTVTPVAPGTATITAEFVGLSKSIQVTVDTPDSLAIAPVNPPVALGSIQLLRVNAVLDGNSFDVTSGATWAFDMPNEAIAKLDALTGVVTGVAEGGPLTAKATFGACVTVLSTQVRVKPILSLDIQREFDPPLTEMIVGTSEILKAIASFDDDGDGDADSTQDLSTQVLFASTNATLAAFSGSPGLTNDLLALRAPTSTEEPVFGIGASFAPTGFTAVEAPNPFELTTVAATLRSIAIAPLTPAIQPLGTQQFKATGSYSDDPTVPDITRSQDITRHVLWTSNNTSEVSISNITTIAGLATSLQNDDSQVTITGSNTSATVTPAASTVLTVGNPPATP